MSVIVTTPSYPVFTGDPVLLDNDLLAPEITTLEVLDVNRIGDSDSYQVTVLVEARDDSSGVSTVEFGLEVDGDYRSFEIYRQDLGAPVQLTLQDAYDVSRIDLSYAMVWDFAGRDRTYDLNDPALPFSSSWTFNFPADQASPVVTEISLSGLTLSADGLSKSFQFRLDATDDLSGVKEARIQLADRNGKLFFDDWFSAGALGQDHAVTVSSAWDLSEVTLVSVQVWDRGNKETTFDANSVPEWWQTSGLPSSWSFGNGGIGADITPPELGQAEILSVGYNADTDSDTITVRLSASDDITGVQYVEMGLLDASGADMGSIWWDASDLDQVWTYDVPGRFDLSTITASYVHLQDNLGNSRTLSEHKSATDLSDMGQQVQWNFALFTAPRQGDASDNTLDGASLHDELHGAGGDDLLRGFDGRDKLFGDDGNDVIIGGRGVDVMHGGNGDDAIYVDNSGDKVDAGAGIDTVHLVEGGLQISLKTWSGVEFVRGSSGDDHVNGSGTYKALELRGFGGNDVLIGGGANDVLIGGDGFDTLLGGASTDLLIGGGDNDRMDGGENSDLYYVTAGDRITDTGTVGYDKAQITSDTGVTLDLEYWFGIERINGHTGNDRIDGSTFDTALLLFGAEGDDRLMGGSAGDVLMGGAGTDTLFGLSGNDTLIGGGRQDRIFAGNGDDIIFLEANDTVDGGDGFDHAKIATANGLTLDLDNWTGVERLSGNAGQDRIDASGLDAAITLVGGGGADDLQGSAFDDHLYGGAGDDMLEGGGGQDVLVGGAGDDVLTGAGGGLNDTEKDMLIGGSGSDRFVWSGAFGRDVVVDFAIGEDTLEIAFTGANAFDNLILEQRGSDTVIRAVAGSTDYLVLANVMAADLSEADFSVIA